MAFIRKTDYLTQIQSDDLDEITQSNDQLLDECERIAIEEIVSHITHRYDTDKVFEVVPLWVTSTPYSIDDVVYFETNNKTYKSKTEHSSATTPDNDSTNWDEIIDPRNAKIVMCCIDLSLYHLHSRINPNNIPEIRGMRRDDCVKWLEGVRDLKNNPTLPDKVDENGNVQGVIKYGSNTKLENRF